VLQGEVSSETLSSSEESSEESRRTGRSSGEILLIEELGIELIMQLEGGRLGISLVKLLGLFERILFIRADLRIEEREG